MIKFDDEWAKWCYETGFEHGSCPKTSDDLSHADQWYVLGFKTARRMAR